MSNKKNTVKAAKAQIAKDTKKNPTPPATSTQGSLADRHVRHHTPEILYGNEDVPATEQP
ncbi:hypothetical protein QEH48_gp048 [Streptomyces phage TurkishDelight]|uniref:Uncharacterized protein n=1 Tax=Streptomyces phage TurkishDelight TaxID=2793708 RepID=A0A7T0Q4F9_9CAUD|nr:hypothetical protein QEH48_gp048 [Streptomyces phage TurkishDelight]QPL14077.1 hypothetical protein SEA_TURKISHDELIGHT_48 [Streptomyces phage TurkishDelight]